MRRLLIRWLLPFCFCMVPLLLAILVAVAVPSKALDFYVHHLSSMDWLILGIGVTLFAVQLALSWRGLQWGGTTFDERPDRWLSTLAQTAEWFPILGLIGTVAGILQTFSRITGRVPQDEIIRLYAPAITATGSGLFMALVNILPTWIVLIGRDLILALSGDTRSAEETTP